MKKESYNGYVEALDDVLDKIKDLDLDRGDKMIIENSILNLKINSLEYHIKINIKKLGLEGNNEEVNEILEKIDNGVNTKEKVFGE